jgi:lysophospholipase L1-like esterase
MKFRRRPIACLAAIAISGITLWGPAAQPASAALSPTLFDRVVTIGDSFAAGTGIHDNFGSYDVPSCWRETDENFSSKMAKLTTGSAANQINVSCIGAEYPQVVSQIDQVGTLPNDGNRSLILLYAMGNDVRSINGKAWPKIVEACVIDGSECSSDKNLEFGNGAEVANRATSLYETLLTRYPRATIRVLGYPRLFTPGITDGRPYCYLGQATGYRGLGIYMSAAEAQWADSKVDSLNALLKSKVDLLSSRGNIRFVDVNPFFTEDGFCRARTNKGLNGIIGNGFPIAQTNVLFSSFHPNRVGHQKIYELLAQSGQLELRTPEQDAPAYNPNGPTPPPGGYQVTQNYDGGFWTSNLDRNGNYLGGFWTDVAAPAQGYSTVDYYDNGYWTNNFNANGEYIDGFWTDGGSPPGQGAGYSTVDYYDDGFWTSNFTAAGEYVDGFWTQY